MPYSQRAALFTLLSLGLAAGCADDSLVGRSGRIPIDSRQSTLGTFHADASATAGDVNGDGFVDLVVWTNASQPRDTSGIPTGPVMELFVFLGSDNGFDGTLAPEDADTTLTLREHEFVAHARTQDLDGDGAAEIVVHALVESSDAFPSSSEITPAVLAAPPVGSVYVVDGAGLPAGVHPIESVGARTPAYRAGMDYAVRAPLPVRDLDGTAGAEFVTEPYRTIPIGVSNLTVRDLATGAARVELVAPENTFMDVRGVLDYDGDGIDDLAVLYVRTEGGNPTLYGSWTAVGLGVFFGPLDANRTLGDVDAPMFDFPGISLAPAAVSSFVLDGAVSTVVGDFGSDDRDDLLFTAVDGTSLFLPGGPRVAPRRVLPLAVDRTTEDERPLWATAVRGGGPSGEDAVFLVAQDTLSLRVPGVTGLVTGVEREDGVLIRRETIERAGDAGAPVFTTLGGAVADFDGDGKLDLALGARADATDRSLVHILYGFGG
ncbi:MAG: FG-GAP repeat protein [Polyangiales bacterium]|nr:hypothetical protein [Myxococcales bacterium]MCB9659226.1 hypothetical protein [Sandaracinaceae bacterium]